MNSHSLINCFAESGITADGRCWGSPSEDFFELWLFDDTLSEHLHDLGFQWGFDGAAVGAWSEFIFYFPANLGAFFNGKNLLESDHRASLPRR